MFATSIRSATVFAPASAARASTRRAVTASAAHINPSIRKEEPKVVDVVVASQQDKPQVAYCRCWLSGTFPMCDGAHAKHNEKTGDNVGPLLVKKE